MASGAVLVYLILTQRIIFTKGTGLPPPVKKSSNPPQYKSPISVSQEKSNDHWDKYWANRNK